MKGKGFRKGPLFATYQSPTPRQSVSSHVHYCLETNLNTHSTTKQIKQFLVQPPAEGNTPGGGGGGGGRRGGRWGRRRKRGPQRRQVEGEGEGSGGGGGDDDAGEEAPPPERPPTPVEDGVEREGVRGEGEGGVVLVDDV